MVTHPQDLALAKKIVSGDRAAFDQMFADLFPRLYRFVLLRSQRDEDLTQDICQQTLERVLKNIDSYRGEASLCTWVCQIARGELAGHWEKQSRQQQRQVSFDQDQYLRHALESLAAEPVPELEPADERPEQALLVQTVLDHLPAPYGEALEWKYVEGLSADEIGTRLSLSAAAAYSLLARARRAFRAEFQALAQELT